MRFATVILAILAWTACKQTPNAEAARQAVVDRLAKAGMPLDALDVEITSFEPKGKEAEATVTLKLKNTPDAAPMVMRYRLEQQGNKWVAIGLASGGGPHGGGAMPDTANPHGGAGAMPAPEDLPPAGKKK